MAGKVTWYQKTCSEYFSSLLKMKKILVTQSKAKKMMKNILKIVQTAFPSHLICLHLLNSGVYIIYLHITETINETSSLITKRWRKKNFPEFNLFSLETGMCVFV